MNEAMLTVIDELPDGTLTTGRNVAVKSERGWEVSVGMPGDQVRIATVVDKDEAAWLLVHLSSEQFWHERLQRELIGTRDAMARMIEQINEILFLSGCSDHGDYTP